MILRSLPATSTSAASLNSRDLCVELVDVGDGLEREVFVDVQFAMDGLAQQSELRPFYTTRTAF